MSSLPGYFKSLAMLLALGAVGSVHAATIPFDPDGGGNGYINIDNLDFGPGNSLFQGIGSLLVDKANQPTTLIIQTRVSNLNNASLGDVTPIGLNVNYEITSYLSAPIKATVIGGNVDYSIDVGASTFELWYDNVLATMSNDLAGTGFREGTLILSGSIATADGAFSVIPLGFTQDFDGFGVDDYAGFQTETIAGGGDVQIAIAYADPNFFGVTPISNLTVSILNTSTITPFDTADPSRLFSGYAPSLVPVNGRGSDFQALADANASFDVIPEPATYALFAGLAGLGLILRRRS